MSDVGDDDCDFTNVPAETPLSPEEAIIRRHRREKRELQGTQFCSRKSIKPFSINYSIGFTVSHFHHIWFFCRENPVNEKECEQSGQEEEEGSGGRSCET
jgi:hypothetical protein